MSRKEWTAVVLVILVGIILQIPSRTGDSVEPVSARGASAAVEPADPAFGPYRSVDLDVSGMT
jgi:hypothetical protein